MDIIDLYAVLDKKFKNTLSRDKYEKVIHKLDKMIGLVYGSLIGLMKGITNQTITEQEAIKNPVIGQFILHIDELKMAKWDPVKYKGLMNYKSVICNNSTLPIELSPMLVEQIKTNKPPNLYNLFSEDFYTRIPICALLGEASIDATIGKIMQTHTSFEASACGIIITSVLRLILINDNIFADSNDWNAVINNTLLPILQSYYNIYQSNFTTDEQAHPEKSQAEKLRNETNKLKLNESYQMVIGKLKYLTTMYTLVHESSSEPMHEEKQESLTDEEKEDMQIIEVYQKELDLLELEKKHSAHPAILAIWTVKSLQAIHKKLDINKLEPNVIFRLMVQSVIAKTGCSAYNALIVGSIIGAIFGFTQIPEDFYGELDMSLMNRVNHSIIDVIKCM